MNRTGAEPYFHTQPFPPKDGWVDSSFSVRSQLTVDHDPFAYFTRATYVPFETLKNIAFDIDPSRLGINHITANDLESSEGRTVIQFPKPPTKLRFILCGVAINDRVRFEYPFLQVCIGFELSASYQVLLTPPSSRLMVNGNHHFHIPALFYGNPSWWKKF